MSPTSSGNRFSVVLGLVIQYLLGEGTFSGRESTRVDIFNSNAGRALGGRLGRPPAAHRSRTPHTPGGYQSHAKGVWGVLAGV